MALFGFLTSATPFRAVVASPRKMLAIFCVVAHDGLARFGSGPSAPSCTMVEGSPPVDGFPVS